MKKLTKSLHITFSAICILLVAAGVVRADALPGIGVTPVRFEFAANAGDRVTGTLRISNGSNAFLPVRIIAEPFTPQGDQGQVVLGEVGEEHADRSLASWMRITHSEGVSVAPGQALPADFTLEVPVGVPPGTYWGALVVRTIPGSIANGAGAGVQTEVGSLVLLRVYGEAPSLVAVKELEIPRIVWTLPFAVSATLENTGAVLEAPEGIFAVQNWREDSVVHVGSERRNVLPGASRRIGGTVDGWLWPGRYTVVFTARYGDGMVQRTGEVSRVVWVLPWKTLVPGMAFVALAVFAWFARRRFAAAWKVLKGEEGPDKL